MEDRGTSQIGQAIGQAVETGQTVEIGHAGGDRQTEGQVVGKDRS